MKTKFIFYLANIFIVALAFDGCASLQKTNIEESKSILFIKDNMELDGKCRIMGRMTNLEDQEPISGGIVIVLSTVLGSATDTNGTYRIPDLPPGAYDIQASSVGFEEVTVCNIELQSNQRIILDFRLTRAGK